MDSVVTQQFQTGQTVFVPSDEQGYEAMSIVESKGFGANAQIKAAPLGSGSSSARTLDAQEKAGIVDSDPLALSGAPDMVKLTKLSAPALLLGALYAVLYLQPQREALPAELPAGAGVTSGALSWPKQGKNECGAYSLALALRLSGREAEGADLVEVVSHRLSWSEALSGTLPWKIQSELARQGLTRQTFSAAGHPRERRLDLLRRHLAAGAPVLFLVESERGSQHYVLAVGYSPEGIDLYDPNFTRDPARSERTLDDNGARPGNRTLSEEALLGLWSGGGGGGLYRWWYLPVYSAPNNQ